MDLASIKEPAARLLLLFASCTLAACGGGGGGSSAKLTSHIIHNPVVEIANQFPSQPVAILPNGNLVIVETYEDNDNNTIGKVSLYNPTTRKFIASWSDDNVGRDNLGSGGITALSNGNFVISSPEDEVEALTSAGSIMLIDGDTGAQIGDTLVGNNASDQIGSDSGLMEEGVLALSNGNFVVISVSDDVGGNTNAGSVMLVNGLTGAVIGTVQGAYAGDNLGSSGVVELANGNIVIASRFADTATLADAGSVILMSGATGSVLGSLVGDNANDKMSDKMSGIGVVALAGGNFVVASSWDDVGGVVDAGSVTVFDGDDFTPLLGFSGDDASDQFGSGPVVALTNGNFVFGSPNDDHTTTADQGSIILADSGGNEISRTYGDGSGSFPNRLVALANGNYAAAAPGYDVGAFVGAGIVMLFNDGNGIQIGETIAGDKDGDQLGGSNLRGLDNGNFLIGSQSDDDDTIPAVNSGSVMLVNGMTGSLISTVGGDNDDDRFGGVLALGNNYVVTSFFDDVSTEGGGTLTDAGSVSFFEGGAGVQLGATFEGAEAGANLSVSEVISNEIVLIQPDPDTIQVIDVTTGAVIDTLAAATAGDFENFNATGAEDGSLYVIAMRTFDHDGNVDAGAIQVVVP